MVDSQIVRTQSCVSLLSYVPLGKLDAKLCIWSGNCTPGWGIFCNDCSAFMVLGFCRNLV